MLPMVSPRSPPPPVEGRTESLGGGRKARASKRGPQKEGSAKHEEASELKRKAATEVQRHSSEGNVRAKERVKSITD